MLFTGLAISKLVFALSKPPSLSERALLQASKPVAAVEQTSKIAYQDSAKLAFITGIFGSIPTDAIGLVSNIQQITITIAAGNTTDKSAAPSPAVSLTATSEHFQGFTTTNTASSSHDEIRPRIELFDDAGTVKLRAFRNTSDAVFTTTIYATLITWKTNVLVGVVRGTVTMTSVASNTGAVSVEQDNSLFFYCGDTDTGASSVYGRITTTIGLTSDTVVTASRSDTTGTTVTGYVLVEFLSGKLDGIVLHYVLTVLSANLTADQTITSRDRTRSMICFGGCSSAGANDNIFRMAHLTFTSDTNVRGTKSTTAGGDSVLRFCVGQFFAVDIINVQRSTIAIAGSSATGDWTMGTAVIVAQTLPNYLGHTGSTAAAPAEVNVYIFINSTTVIRNTRATAGTGTIETSAEAIQFVI